MLRSTALAVVPALLIASTARAGTFDALGDYHADPNAVAYLDFSKAPDRYLPSDAPMVCDKVGFSIKNEDDALDTSSVCVLKIDPACVERLLFTLPAKKASYRVTLWQRHGSLDARIAIVYTPDSKLDTVFAMLAPTGRVTSDGWVELATNDFSVDGANLSQAYLRVKDVGASNGVEIDGLEVVPHGEYEPQASCTGRSDPTCGGDHVCNWGHCLPGGPSVPPLPADVIKNTVVDVLEGKLRAFYGGKFSRAQYLGDAITTMEKMRGAKTGFQFWNAWATAIHQLHDWHTGTSGQLGSTVGPSGRLNACFIEGNADISHKIWPKDPRFADILVSHVGANDAQGLAPGDRLVAVDGFHPIDWAQGLATMEWGYHVATDPTIYADYVEALGGPFWIGGAMLLKWATELTFVKCDAQTGTCDPTPVTVKIADMMSTQMGPDVVCDNRPQYHLQANGPDPNTHYVFDKIFRDRIAGTQDAEQIFGMVWDNLYGANDPNSYVNQNISQAIADWKASARGVILDHRAGNGGTLDAASNLTTLSRDKGVSGVIRWPIEIAGDDGPIDDAAGLALFMKYQTIAPYETGDTKFDPDLPVALIIHRDGSASDFMPYAMKGGPKTKLFGPHGTAGAFSTFITFTWADAMGFQFGSGDTIAPDGKSLIGHGVTPDVIVAQKQSDLLAGKDSIHEAALAWVRQELKP